MALLQHAVRAARAPQSILRQAVEGACIAVVVVVIAAEVEVA